MKAKSEAEHVKKYGHGSSAKEHKAWLAQQKAKGLSTSMKDAAAKKRKSK